MIAKDNLKSEDETALSPPSKRVLGIEKQLWWANEKELWMYYKADGLSSVSPGEDLGFSQQL